MERNILPTPTSFFLSLSMVPSWKSTWMRYQEATLFLSPWSYISSGKLSKGSWNLEKNVVSATWTLNLTMLSLRRTSSLPWLISHMHLTPRHWQTNVPEQTNTYPQKFVIQWNTNSTDTSLNRLTCLTSGTCCLLSWCKKCPLVKQCPPIPTIKWSKDRTSKDSLWPTRRKDNS